MCEYFIFQKSSSHLDKYAWIIIIIMRYERIAISKQLMVKRLLLCELRGVYDWMSISLLVFSVVAYLFEWKFPIFFSLPFFAVRVYIFTFSAAELWFPRHSTSENGFCSMEKLQKKWKKSYMLEYTTIWFVSECMLFCRNSFRFYSISERPWCKEHQNTYDSWV